MPKLLPTIESFNSAIESSDMTVVHFSADWVEQCDQVNDLLVALSKRREYSKIKFYRIHAEELSEITLKYKVEAVPTVVLFRSSKTIDRINGADPVTLTDKIKLYGDVKDSEAVPLEERLKELINKAPIMLFMKGDRCVPRCGFSRQMIEILDGIGVSYETFDILSDDEVRQGLKTYSKWPTYPQLYVKGELIGGLDIVKEMQAGGELDSALKG